VKRCIATFRSASFTSIASSLPRAYRTRSALCLLGDDLTETRLGRTRRGHRSVLPAALAVMIAIAVVGHQVAKTVIYYTGAGVFELPRGKLRDQLSGFWPESDTRPKSGQNTERGGFARLFALI
jgi:hypothetical protein